MFYALAYEWALLQPYFSWYLVTDAEGGKPYYIEPEQAPRYVSSMYCGQIFIDLYYHYAH